MRIYTDTASDMTKKDAEIRGLSLFDIGVDFPDGVFSFHVEEDKDRFFRRLEESGMAKTSSPSIGSMIRVFEEGKKAGEEIVYITMSSFLSSTYETALQAKEIVDYEGIYVVDSHMVCKGQALMAEWAVKMKEEGKSSQEIVDWVTMRRDDFRYMGTFMGLDHLVKGGRLPAAVGLAGKMLNIKPVVSMDGGVLGLYGKARGIRASIKKILDRYHSEEVDLDFPIYFIYTYPREEGKEFIDYAQTLLGDHRGKIAQMGPVVGTHIGPGCFGLAYVVRHREK